MTFRIRTIDVENEEAWKDLLCEAKCMRLAAVAVDGIPLCLEHADEQFDYDCARSLFDGYAKLQLNPLYRD